MISILEGKDLLHHGINKDHKPSGYTVDTCSSDSSIIAEYFNQTDIFLNNREKIEIYDSHRIAKTIYQQSIENPSYADFYKDFFSDFSQEIDSWEYYGKMPVQCENFYSEPAVLETIDNHGEENSQFALTQKVIYFAN